MISHPLRLLSRRVLTASLLSLSAASFVAQAQTASVPDAALAGLHWRDVGPMRGGRSYAVSGIASQPDVFYMGSVGGGLWKTLDAGRTWKPVADDARTGIPIGSIGAIAVAPSNPSIVYVGTGEPDIRSQHSYGVGMFKSTDEGRTWTHIGLENSQHIGRIVVDPANPDRVYVAVLGHVYDPNPERGVYRSLDGGKSWKKVLASATDPDNVGAIELAINPRNPKVVYASLWATRRPPWSVYAPSYMPGSGLYKSTDGGDTWRQLHGGLPDDNFVGKIGIAVAPSHPNLLWAVVDDNGSANARVGGPPAANANPNAPKPKGGIYRSSDAGATWHLVNDEQRLWGRGWYFESITIDPANPEVAYDINTATYRTEDGGKSWLPVKGAPGGDDYHQLWINPKDRNRMVLSSDQGTVVSVDYAHTWSTWYNQPTAEIYHISADNRFPYWLYGAQQDSGGVGVSTWSRMGTLSFRNWEPTCLAGESATVVPDPKDGNILFGGGAGRCDQNLNVAASLGGQLPAADPDDPNRKTWTLPEVFSEADEALYYSNQFVFRTRNRGKSWEKISPDLARMNPELPKTLDAVTAKDIDQAMTTRFGVVYSLGPSPIKATTVWAGTDDGLIYVTHDDGRKWDNVTPPEMTAWSKVSGIVGSYHDVATAYASVDRHRLADMKPYIYRTHDGGKSWTNVVNGIPEGAFVNAVKEDPKVKGLLYAATELRVYISFNDGDNWQPLQLDMPVTSVRDIAVHGEDLDIATHGRGFWVMDQMPALRELATHASEIVSSPVYLYKPGVTIAAAQGGQNGTPLPHEEPQELNPPQGVMVYYWLKDHATGPLKLELVDSKGRVTACAASDTPTPAVDTEKINVEAVWEEPSLPPSAEAGMHRVALNVAAPRGFGGGGGGGRGAAPPRPHDACSPPEGTVAAAPAPRGGAGGGGGARRGPVELQPGEYTVRLSVDGKTYTQPSIITPDPRGNPLDTAVEGTHARS